MTHFDIGRITDQTEPATLIIDRWLTVGTVTKAAEALTGTLPDGLIGAARRSTSLRQAIPVVLDQSRRVRASIHIPGKGVFWGTVSRIDAENAKLTLDTNEGPQLNTPVRRTRSAGLHHGDPCPSDAAILDQLLGDAAGSETELAELLRHTPARLHPALLTLLDRVWSHEARIDYVIASSDGPAMYRRARLDMGSILDQVAEARFGPYGSIERPARLPAMTGNPLLSRRLLRQSLHYLLPETGHSGDALRVFHRRTDGPVVLVIENREPLSVQPRGEMRQAQAAAIMPILAHRQNWQAESGRKADGACFVEFIGPAA